MEECEFYIQIDGIINKCSNKANGGIGRTHSLCRTHFNKIRQDNIKRTMNGIDIPINFELLKPINKNSIEFKSCNKVIEKPSLKEIIDETIWTKEDEDEWNKQEWIVE